MLGEFSNFSQINDKTMVSVEDLQMPQGACECTRDAATLNKGEEHLRLLLRVSSVRLISALQNLAHQANAEIDFLVQRTKHKLYEKIETEFPRLLSQMSVSDSIEELIHRLRNQLFISTDLSPRHIEKEMEKAVQNFFMQIMPPTFLCITTGPCRSVTQSYANCLRNNSPSWKTFYGNRPNEMAAKLRRAILKYRVIEKTIDKLHMSVIDIETINISCIARFTAVVYCGLQCSQLEGSGSPVGYCSESCTNAVHSCLGESAKDWDSFVTILRKLSVEFDHGFVELERGIISSLSYALGVQAPAIAKIILKKCGPINPTKSAPSNTTLEYAKPPAVQKKLVGMIRKFTSYIGWWQRLAQNVCGDASRISACWNGSALISRCKDIFQQRALFS
ncbi:unnamed protein product [Toxocara canis]|uniref:Glypican-6 n=1 Tax=Toxocara canis TaxID=6265 RepID=A0A183UY26_TOXCA|nr:unnamed protein product [Toxocara canis]